MSPDEESKCRRIAKIGGDPRFTALADRDCPLHRMALEHAAARSAFAELDAERAGTAALRERHNELVAAVESLLVREDRTHPASLELRQSAWQRLRAALDAAMEDAKDG